MWASRCVGQLTACSGSQASSLLAAWKSCCVSHRNPSCCLAPSLCHVEEDQGLAVSVVCAGSFSAALSRFEGQGLGVYPSLVLLQPERATGWLRTAGPSRVGDKLAGRPQPHVGGGGGGAVHVQRRREEQSALHCAEPRRSPQLPAPPAGPSRAAVRHFPSGFFPSTPRVLIVR